MALGNRLLAQTVAERKFRHRLSFPTPTWDGGWVVAFRDHPSVAILDGQLNPQRRFKLQAPAPLYKTWAVATNRDGQLFALSGQTESWIVNRRGILLHRILNVPSVEVSTSSNCVLDLKGRMWYVQTGDQPGINDRLRIISPTSGEIIVEQTITNYVGAFHLFLCPDQESVLIDVGCGQDGSSIYLARLSGTELTITEYPFFDRTFIGGFSPDGREFVTGAHNGDALKVHSFPSGRIVASAESRKIFAGDELSSKYPDEVEYFALFLDNDHILADTRFGRMILLHRKTMRLLGTVWPEAYRLRGYDTSGQETDDTSRIVSYESGLTWIQPAGRGKLLTVHDMNVLRLLDVTHLLSPGKNRK